MRVFLDARMFYHSGIGRYSRNLHRELLKLNPAPRLTLGLDEQVRRCLEAEMSRPPDFIPFNAPIYSVREQIYGSYLSRRYRREFDLFHFPHYNIPWLTPQRMVVTCHDLIHLLFPQYFSAVKVFFAHRLLKRVANQAKVIITVSQHTRQDFLRFFPEAEEKLRVVYNGVGENFKPLPTEQVSAFKNKQQLEDFLLFVGNLKPNKNLPRLIAAYAQLKTCHPTLKLIILSQKIYNNNEINSTISRWGVQQGVILHQPLNHREMVLYYNAAKLLVFPSLYEGFGLPPLEAMACGTPVVASNTSSIVEVVADAAVMIDPTNVESIAAGIDAGLSDSIMREKLRKAGLSRAHKFSWEKTARQTLRVYQEAVG